MRLLFRDFAFIAAVLGLSLTIAPTSRAAAESAIDISVDASDAAARIIHTRMTVPVSRGAVTFVYPRWTSEEHFPSGVVNNLSNLSFRVAGGPLLTWRRDLVRMDAFHVDIPAGINELEIRLDYFLPAPDTSRANSSARLLMLRWNNVLLYPEGQPVRQILVQAHLKLPERWKFATALPVTTAAGRDVTFDRTTLAALVDTPVICGEYVRSIPIPGQAAVPHFVDVAAESEMGLAMSMTTQGHAVSLVTQAERLFGSAHFPLYHFLIVASDHTSHGGGLEHSTSSDIRVPGGFYSNPALERSRYNMMSHEYVHSWNGKFRVPEGHATRTLQEPLRSDLLWVYEGLTMYLGNVLGARAGFATAEYAREHLAWTAAGAGTQTGRRWRPLQDTADSTPALMGADFSVPTGWDSRHRAEDFYDEGALIWLEVDARIRNLTSGRRSLDDFAHDFLGGQGRFPDIHPYVAADVFAALNKLAPYDWQGFFQQRLTSLSADAPLGGLAASGWKLVMDASPNRFVQDWAERSAILDLRFSLGLLLGHDGSIEDVIEASPAGRAGMFPGGRIVALNGRTWSDSAMEEGLRATPSTPLVLRVEFAGGEREYSLDYHGGPRYPHLQRVADSPDLLSAIFAERGAGSAGEAGASEATAASLRDAALRGRSVAYDFVRDLTTLGPRPAGSANDGIAAEWAADRLRTLGFQDVRVETFPLSAWDRGEERVEIVGPHPQRLVAAALGGSPATPSTGVEGDVEIFNSLDELRARPEGALAGKIAMITYRMQRDRGIARYGPAAAGRSAGPGEAARRGAIGFLLRSVGTDNNRLAHVGATRYIEGRVPVPSFALAAPDADQLERLAAQGKPVRVHLYSTARLIRGSHSQNVIADIRGRDKAGELVLLAAHLDSWDLGTGAIDDAAGAAIVVAAAKLVADQAVRPRRSVRVVLYGAEEPSQPDDPAYARGGRTYLQRHQAELPTHVLAGESDLGADDIYAVSLPPGLQRSALATSVLRVLAPLGIELAAQPEDLGVDIAPLVESGVPSFSLLQDATRYFDIHHTADDTLDKIDRTKLERNVAAWSALTWLAADSPLPLRGITRSP